MEFKTWALGDKAGAIILSADPSLRTGLTLTTITEHVAHYTYKPGWRLTIEQLPEPDPDRWESWCRLVATTRGTDSTQPEDNIVITSSIEIPIGVQLESLNRAIRYLIEWREIHELREWLKFNDRLVDPPPH